MKTMIGSCAVHHWLPEARCPQDVDYFTDEIVDFGDCFYHPDLEKYNWSDVATLDECYTIKISHIFWELKNSTWDKHWFDILYLQDKANFIPELFDILYPIWEERYGKKKVNLNAEPKDFFNSNIVRIYDHDSIHASVAYYDYPLFERVLRDGSEVMVDWIKFEALDELDQLHLISEEIYATALERQVIPSNYSINSRVAYFWALKKTITSFWKGKWATFIALNARELNKPDIDYVKKHRENKEKLIKL